MLKITVATHNIHKTDEIKNYFRDFPVKIYSMTDLGLQDEIEEAGNTIEENALIKARTLKGKVDSIIIADDTGLFVDCMGGQPGVYSARFAGDSATFEDNNRKLLQMLKDVPMDKRRAHFKTVLAVINKDEEIIIEGRIDGYILTEPKGINGFGYDPVFYVDSIGKTLAELTTKEKNEISHRALALKKLKNYLYKDMEEDK